MPIEGLPSSNQQAAAAGTGGILSTGFDRKARTEPNAVPPDNDPKAKFKDLLIEMISSDGVSEVNSKRQRKPHEEEMFYQQELAKISERRLDSVVKKAEKKRPKKEGEKKEEESETKAPGETGGLSAAAEYISFTEKAKIIEETLLKDYVALTAKMVMQRPKDELDNVTIRLAAVKEALMKGGLIGIDLEYLDQKTLDMIKERFLKLIKDKFFSSASGTLHMSDWIINAKNPRSIIDILNALEKESISLSERAVILNNLDISDLAQLAEHLNLDIDSMMKMFLGDNVHINRLENADMYFHLFDLPQMKDISVVVGDLRTSHTKLFLEDNIFKAVPERVTVRRLENTLKDRGMEKENIDNIRTQSRRIAWLKIISMLKQSHLNRILTTSSREFDVASKEISRLTKKSNTLGYDIPKEGIKWIETGLEKLALDTAIYKLELLRSLQKISFDPNRNRDIQHLSAITASLSRRTAR
ncbi:MAG: hypothetical protein NTZ10_07215 [Candidatus Saganbacteria bacterium]|nr:hypothetical protein [Candidatus Saganbacteria bacterium]